MEIPKKAKTSLAIAAVVALVALFYALPMAIGMGKPESCMADGVCQHELFAENVATLTPFALLARLALGAAAQYFYEERKQAAPKAAAPGAALLLLDNDERRVAEKIIVENGRALQSEISRLEGMGKVKAHRVIARMEKRGAVQVERHGKTNIVRFAKESAELFGP